MNNISMLVAKPVRGEVITKLAVEGEPMDAEQLCLAYAFLSDGFYNHVIDKKFSKTVKNIMKNLTEERGIDAEMAMMTIMGWLRSHMYETISTYMVDYDKLRDADNGVIRNEKGTVAGYKWRR